MIIGYFKEMVKGELMTVKKGKKVAEVRQTIGVHTRPTIY